MTQIEFWKQRWENQQTGFHEGHVNNYLEKYWSTLNLSTDASIFLPLSGKSQDLMWLSKHCSNVIGVECSELAVTTFFKENDLLPKLVTKESKTNTNFTVWQAENITLYCGDLFELESSWFDAVDLIFDRAALVALDHSLRQKYQKKIYQLCPKASILLVSFEYPQQQMDGPPFSVSETEINALYESDYSIIRQESNDILLQPDNEKFKQRGLSSLYEKVFLIKAQ